MFGGGGRRQRPGWAERVFRTQPAASIAISKLEWQFEAPLFDRSKRQEYWLTQVGETLYSHATRMLRKESHSQA
jgi:DNA-binding transcriptional LysR family regulator